VVVPSGSAGGAGAGRGRIIGQATQRAPDVGRTPAVQRGKAKGGHAARAGALRPGGQRERRGAARGQGLGAGRPGQGAVE